MWRLVGGDLDDFPFEPSLLDLFLKYTVDAANVEPKMLSQALGTGKGKMDRTYTPSGTWEGTEQSQ